MQHAVEDLERQSLLDLGQQKKKKQHQGQSSLLVNSTFR